MAMMRCPACGRDVPVSEALYCPFCGQTLRRVFADGSTSAPGETPALVPGSVPATPPAHTSSEFAQSAQSAAGWTPYPEQSVFQSAPATEQHAVGVRPAAQLIRNQAVVASALAVILIGALLIFERVRISQMLLSLPGSFPVRYIVFSEIPYLVMALAASYWLAWLRLSRRRPSNVTIEAAALSIVILLAGPIVIILALRVAGPSYYHDANPFGSWTYLTAHVSLFLWIALLSLAFGALGVRLADTCAAWPLMRQSARPATPIADFFKVFGACALLLIADVLIVNWVRFVPITLAAELTLLTALVVATLLAVRSGKRRLGTV